ncbi:hypothetical protein ACIJDF_001547 [Enterococcus hirae]
MFKKSNFICCIASLLLGLTPLVTFGTNVYASGIVDNRSDPIEFYKENSDYFDVQVEEDSTIVTITDNNLKAFLEMKGLDSSFLSKKQLTPRSNGVTKNVWHGQARKGNVDIYISKTWLNNISKAGIGAIVGALGSLLPGAGWGSAIGGISGVITGGNFKHGRVFVVRGFVYQYYYLQ